MGNRALQFKPISVARTRHKLARSKVSVFALSFVRLLSPLYQRYALKCTSMRIAKPAEMLSLWRDSQEGRTRLILAFRHPYSDEPQVFFHIINEILPREARKAGRALPRRPHTRFVHGYEVALWGDAAIRWIMPRIGAVPIHHTKLDSGSLKAIRAILSDDEYPLAIAPEGQVSYRSETVPRLEQGALQMGFWCVQDLEKAGRHEKVVILPLSIHYQYDRRDEKKLSAILNKLEARCGIASRETRALPAKDRLIAIDARIFELAENHYAAAYGYKVPPNAEKSAGPEGREQLARRRDALLGAALEIAERALGLTRSHAHTDNPKDEREKLIGRVYKIRQECWDRIYPVMAQEFSGELERALADRRAGEAWYAMRHMEFVDIAFYLDADYLDGRDGAGTSFDRLAETAHNLADLMNRLAGGTISHRLDSMRKKVVIMPGSALDMSVRAGNYKENRKKAVEEACDALNASFKECIKEYLDGNDD